MADTEKNLNVKITSRYDGAGTDAAAAGIKKTESQLESLKKEMADAGYSTAKWGDSIKGMLTNLVAFATIIDQLKAGYEDYAVSAKAFKQLEMATTSTGDAFAKTKAEVLELSDRLKVTAAVADDKSVPAIVRLYREYGNMEEATKAVNLAVGVAAKYGLTFEEGINAVRMASMGNVKALREMGIAFEGVTGATEKADVALGLLVKSTKGAYVDTGSLSYQVKRLGVQWDDFRGDLVAKLMPALKWLVAGLKTIPEAIAVIGTALGNMAANWMERFSFMGAAMKAALSGNFSEIKTLYTDANNRIKANNEDTMQALVTLSLNAEKAFAAGSERISVEAAKVPKALVRDFGAATKEVAREMTAAESALLAATNSNTKMILDAYHKRAVAEKAMYAESVKQANHLVDVEEATTAQTVKIKAKAADLKKELAKAELNAQIAVAEGVVALASGVFGQTKEIAIASAIVNTFAGATRAFADYPYPYNAVVAALVAAAGLANIAQIESAEPSTTGKGFDDPSNDRAAYLGGRRWAEDMLRNHEAGVNAGWAAGMGGGRSSVSNTYDNRKTTNVTIQGAGLLDPSSVQMVKRLRRTMDIVELQVEGGRTVSR